MIRASTSSSTDRAARGQAGERYDGSFSPGRNLSITLGGYPRGFPGNYLGGFADEWKTMAHEIGHLSTLKHGGTNHDNYKTFYLSLMNYAYENCPLGKNGEGRERQADTLRGGMPDQRLLQKQHSGVLRLGSSGLLHQFPKVRPGVRRRGPIPRSRHSRLRQKQKPGERSPTDSAPWTWSRRRCSCRRRSRAPAYRWAARSR